MAQLLWKLFHSFANRNVTLMKQADSTIRKRKLVYIPIVHTQADMGAFRESIRRAHLKQIGKTALKHKLNAVDRIWDGIEKTIKRLDFSHGRVRLYQDGLPVCGKEKKIVKDLADAGSRNHTLLLRLMEKGALIMGTESPELLMEEYKRFKKILVSGDAAQIAGMEADQKDLSRSLLKSRDRFIAARINETLLPGETGILFLGMLHALGSLLDEDIRVVYPLHQPAHI